MVAARECRILRLVYQLEMLRWKPRSRKRSILVANVSFVWPSVIMRLTWLLEYNYGIGRKLFLIASCLSFNVGTPQSSTWRFDRPAMALT
jgi:hypothetical protein